MRLDLLEKSIRQPERTAAEQLGANGLVAAVLRVRFSLLEECEGIQTCKQQATFRARVIIKHRRVSKGI